jgi:hypothetical protein
MLLCDGPTSNNVTVQQSIDIFMVKTGPQWEIVATDGCFVVQKYTQSDETVITELWNAVSLRIRFRIYQAQFDAIVAVAESSDEVLKDWVSLHLNITPPEANLVALDVASHSTLGTRARAAPAIQHMYPPNLFSMCFPLAPFVQLGCELRMLFAFLIGVHPQHPTFFEIHDFGFSGICVVAVVYRCFLHKCLFELCLLLFLCSLCRTRLLTWKQPTMSTAMMAETTINLKVAVQCSVFISAVLGPIVSIISWKNFTAATTIAAVLAAVLISYGIYPHSKEIWITVTEYCRFPSRIQDWLYILIVVIYGWFSANALINGRCKELKQTSNSPEQQLSTSNSSARQISSAQHTPSPTVPPATISSTVPPSVSSVAAAAVPVELLPTENEANKNHDELLDTVRTEFPNTSLACFSPHFLSLLLRRYSTDDAMKKVRATLRWRIANEVDTLQEADVQEQLAIGDMFWHNTDRQGRPVLYIRPARQDMRKYNRDAKLRAGIFLIEYGIQHMAPGITGYVLVIDTEGVGYAHFDRQMIQNTIQLGSVAYSDRVERVVIGPMNFLATTAYAFAKPIIASMLAGQNIDIAVTKALQQELEKSIDTANLPPFVLNK